MDMEEEDRESASENDLQRNTLEEILIKSQKSEREFSEKAHWYEFLLDALYDTPISVTDMNKNITFINRIGLTILGKTRDEAIGKFCGDVWDVDICRDERCGIECLKRGKGLSEFRLGDSIYTTLASYIQDLDGNHIGHIEVVTNITDSQKREQQIRQSEEMHRIKDKLFSVVSHDMRGQMAALSSILRLAAESHNDDMKVVMTLLKSASLQVEKTYEMFDNLLRWAKSQMQGIAANPVCCEIQKESNSITDVLQNMAVSKKISLTNHIGKQQVHVDCDMLHVIIRNLTINALKFTPSGGEVTLSSELKDNMLIVSVKDTGTGMTDEVRDKLFQLSRIGSCRGTDNENGSGLGLILCADFVKTIGGNIWFTTELGKGSTFYFSIPVRTRV